MNLNGKKIIVTGGSSGIGLELGAHLVREGARVVLVARNKEKLEAAKVKIGAEDFISADLNDSQGIEKLSEFIANKHPDLSVLINNAGIMKFTPNVDSEALDFLKEQIQTNLIAPFELTQRLLPILQKNKGAAIANVSSGIAYMPIATTSAYCASKAALHSLTLSMRSQLQSYGINVFEIFPPAVDTPLSKDIDTSKISTEQVARDIINGFKADRFEIRIGQSQQLYFMSRLAPGFIFNMLNKKVT